MRNDFLTTNNTTYLALVAFAIDPQELHIAAICTITAGLERYLGRREQQTLLRNKHKVDEICSVTSSVVFSGRLETCHADASNIVFQHKV